MPRPSTRRALGRPAAAAAALVLLPLGVTFATATATATATASATATTATATAAQRVAPRLVTTPPPRPVGPCDLYAAGGTPCVAAHSTTRALYASYNGPLYQVMRLSDHAVKDIGVVQPSASAVPDPGGYADSAAQDAFCANTTCVITKIYDQSPNHNDLTQAPRGAFSGPALGGLDNLPIANMAPVSLGGHKVYGVFIEPGMGLRDNHPTGTAVGDQPEGMYWVIDGHHFNDGCCFDYGNAEIDSRDDGDGTMETSYFGNATAWYHGNPPGPWVMTDQENNLVGCVNPGSTSKLCPTLPNITSRFVTAVAKGQPHQWESEAGDAQVGSLSTMFSGPRVDATYDPMRKQGAIVLGNGGDNSNGAQGTFYEGLMTAGYPSDATDQLVQANIVAAQYSVQTLSLTPATDAATPPGLQTFTPQSSQDSTLTYTNTTGSAVSKVKLSVSVDRHGWTAVAEGTSSPTVSFRQVAAGASVSATFKVTSGPGAFNGDLVGKVRWRSPGSNRTQSQTTTEKVRNVSPIKINEFRAGTSSNPTNSFIELYNAGNSAVDLSRWIVTEHAAQQPVFSNVTIPDGTMIAGHGFYLLGLANSGLAAPAGAGDSTVYLSSTSGMAPGQQVKIGTGPTADTRTITHITSTGATGPRVPGKIGNAVKLSGNGEYVSLPSGIVSGLHDFTISAWVNPSANSAWSRIFDFGTGTSDYMFLTLSAGGGPLRFAITTNGNGAEQQLNGPGTLPLNTWSHVAVTLSGQTGTLYVNGQAVATNPNMTLNPAALGTTSQNWIGRSQFADPFMAGDIDDFQIYDHALSAADIAALAGGQPGAGNVASYKFDEDSGEVALDSSGNGRNATIISPGNFSTPLWQPVPDGPITIPAGSTNVPVTNASGFAVGQKLAIGFGKTFETATVTAVGTPGSQAYLAAAAAAGATSIKVTSTANITAGDTIKLDIGASTETVTVASVGTAGARGTGLTLTAPLRFAHPSNLPFSDRGTGITFSPATRFAHSSDEPVQALTSSITLGSPLRHGHAINDPVLDGAVTTAGYQGSPAPDLWFGGPALSASAGSIVLSNRKGVVADSLNYGGIVDPWAAEGYQAASGAGQGGCFAPSPVLASEAGRSDIRLPDGTDTDSNCADFVITNNPTPGAANQSFTLDPGPLVSLQTTSPGGNSGYLKHDDSDDLVVVAPVTATSALLDRQDSTFVETAGLANPACVSFESVNKPGSYLRHQNFQFHLQPNDGSALFSMDATFCPGAGNSGQGTSFQSVNFPGRFIRNFNNVVFLAADGGSNPWDTATGWPADTSWLVNAPLAPAP
jgi:Alpha-L-arabinofuranosidase B, catalytic/Alpha-L-arabinofuranosidase B (ABFB) domain/Concanavalin A-like lectin/glucanases superfamily/NPCBM-associated, NEW3 domain of alpha-galactosidase/Lamin Tail Domain